MPLQTEDGGGGGDIGKRNFNGGGDGGDDGGDDDDYFGEADDGDDGDDGGLFGRRIAVPEVTISILSRELGSCPWVQMHDAVSAVIRFVTVHDVGHLAISEETKATFALLWISAL